MAIIIFFLALLLIGLDLAGKFQITNGKMTNYRPEASDTKNSVQIFQISFQRSHLLCMCALIKHIIKFCRMQIIWNPFSIPKHQLKCISQSRISRIHISNFVIKPFFRCQMRNKHFSRLNKDWKKCFLIFINFVSQLWYHNQMMKTLIWKYKKLFKIVLYNLTFPQI